MTTPSTTLEAIRDNMITRIQALAPTKLSDIAFRCERAEAAFPVWAEQNASAALRRFSIREMGEGEPPLVSDMSVEFRLARLLVLIAYPKQWATYGLGNARDADDLWEADRELIAYGRSGIGHTAAAYYVSGQSSALVRTIDREDLEAVILGRMRVEVTYYRSVAS